MNVAVPAETPAVITETSTTMRAGVLTAPRKLRAQGVPRPAMADDQVLIRTHFCGVCPSDVRWFTGERTDGSYPRMLGHEWAGVVERVGSLVTSYAEGDRVVPDWRVVCGSCHYCRQGVANYCENVQTSRVRGGYAEYGVALAMNLRKVPASVSFEEACFTEPLACCLNGNRMCGIREGSDVVVLGAGPIGLLHVQLAKLRGARVIVADPLRRRLPDARNLGADELVLPDEDPVAKVQALTEGRGADAVIVAVGATKAMQQAVAMAGINGVVNFFAGQYPAEPLQLDPNRIHYRQLRLTGSHDYTPDDFTKALKLIALRAVRVKELISHVLPLDYIEQAFQVVAERQGLKVLIDCIGGLDG